MAKATSTKPTKTKPAKAAPKARTTASKPSKTVKRAPAPTKSERPADVTDNGTPKAVNLNRLRRHEAIVVAGPRRDPGFVPSLVIANLCILLALAAVVAIVRMDWRDGLFVLVGYTAGAIGWYDICKHRRGRA